MNTFFQFFHLLFQLEKINKIQPIQILLKNNHNQNFFDIIIENLIDLNKCFYFKTFKHIVQAIPSEKIKLFFHAKNSQNYTLLEIALLHQKAILVNFLLTLHQTLNLSLTYFLDTLFLSHNSINLTQVEYFFHNILTNHQFLIFQSVLQYLHSHELMKNPTIINIPVKIMTHKFTNGSFFYPDFLSLLIIFKQQNENSLNTKNLFKTIQNQLEQKRKQNNYFFQNIYNFIILLVNKEKITFNNKNLHHSIIMKEEKKFLLRLMLIDLNNKNNTESIFQNEEEKTILIQEESALLNLTKSFKKCNLLGAYLFQKFDQKLKTLQTTYHSNSLPILINTKTPIVDQRQMLSSCLQIQTILKTIVS